MKTSFSRYAPVAQLESEHAASTRRVGSSSLSWGANYICPLSSVGIRAPGYEPGGREFESLSGCHSNKGFVDYLEMYQVMTGKILPGPGKHFYLIFLKKNDIIYM